MLGDQRLSWEVARRRSGTPTIAQERITFAIIAIHSWPVPPLFLAERLHVSGGWRRKHKHLTSAFRSGALSRRFSSFSFQHSCASGHKVARPSLATRPHRCTPRIVAPSRAAASNSHTGERCARRSGELQSNQTLTKWRIAIQSDEVANCNPIRP